METAWVKYEGANLRCRQESMKITNVGMGER